MMNNYDHIARYYDRLSRLVFFKSQLNAQLDQLQYLPEKGRVLIVGGGTGWILEEIAKVRPDGLSLVYVEISTKMIELSKQRVIAGNTVEFVNLGIEDFSSDAPFDVVCTPFLFDNFAEQRAVMVFKHLDVMLRGGGLWFHTDFSLAEGTGSKNKVKGGWWKAAFLSVMYRFFKLVGNVEASSLINMMPYFITANYKLLEERYYYKKFIQSLVFQKATENIKRDNNKKN
ncbi:class I SAM-dependent methyltransferase [Pedobacter gandavensis]|uniref:class I SAM-dependent methyltransferase n=1 Tax=Pedobacter gandavensis TaxID=2679963 RepID=UPI00292CDE0B|nr:class I SAM-dependent methyltransferase [Pedobacter gandavensis]